MIKCNCGGSGVDAVGVCPACGGSGKQRCERGGCDKDAVGFNDDGEALCGYCLFEWQMEQGSE